MVQTHVSKQWPARTAGTLLRSSEPCGCQPRPLQAAASMSRTMQRTVSAAVSGSMPNEWHRRYISG